MPANPKSGVKRPPARVRRASTAKDHRAGPGADAAVAELRKLATRKTLDGMSRYGLPSDKALGVAVGDIQKVGKRFGHDHKLAEALWGTDIYEARLLASFVGEPEKLTGAQMDRWCRDFDNWGVCDTICFKLFDRSPMAWDKAALWAKSEREFVKRAGYVLMACLAQHDKAAADARFLPFLPLIEEGAADGRNFVKKGVSWALRGIGRRSRALHKSALAIARRLAASSDPPRRWVGKDVLRDLESLRVREQVAATGARPAPRARAARPRPATAPR